MKRHVWTLLLWALPSTAGPEGFLWISQGAALPPSWIAGLPAAGAWLVWGSFSFCDRTLDLPRFRHVCLPEVRWTLGRPVVGNMTYTPGRNVLYRHALEFEEERGQTFMYFVFADDSGEFVFNRCSESACGNTHILPEQSESAVSFFHRLLLEDTPAVATPLNDIDDSECLSPVEMRVCTSSIDHKVIAFHWSVHGMLLPYEQGFEHISLFASQCIVNDVIDAVLPGNSVRYRMFRRPSSASSSFPIMRPHYIRNLEPCLPQLLPNGSIGDSSVVKWLRPQLNQCAASKLGASHILQAGCQFGIHPNERCNLRSDYSVLDCFPWARAETCGFLTQGESRPPKSSGIYHVMRLSRSFGAGSSSRVREETDPSKSCRVDEDYACARGVLCTLGMDNFTELRASFKFPPSDELREAWSTVDGKLKAVLWEKRDEVDRTCDICTSLLLGASVPEDFLQENFRAYTEMGFEKTEQALWNWWWCLVAFLYESPMVLFSELSSVAPLDMLVFLTERSLPLQQRPSVSPADAAEALSLLAASQRPFLEANPSSECDLGLSVQHLIGAAQDERWRQGHVFAAQHYLAHCGLLELASPITAYFWHLFAVVGRQCIASPASPPTSPCGHRLRKTKPQFLAMKPQKVAPLVLRTPPPYPKHLNFFIRAPAWRFILMAVTSPRRSERLRSALLDGRSGFSPVLESASAASPKQCGACLLDIDTVSKDGDFVAILESCKSLHFFHVRCISTWAAQENTCPLCKVRFSRFGIYGANGDLRRVSNVEERDQQEDAEGGSEEVEEVVCSVCQRSDDDEALLLCDGLGGQCSGAAHFYCLGLPGVPEGDWFCSECQELPVGSQSDSQDVEQVLLGASSQDSGVAREAKKSTDFKEVKTPPMGEAKQVLKEASKESPKSMKRASDLPVASSSSKKLRTAREVAAVKQEVDKEHRPNNLRPLAPRSSEAQWIQITGSALKIDLGGRRIKDAAATAVAKLVRSVVEKLLARHPAFKPLVSLNLAGNRLGKVGLMTMLQAMEVVEPVRVAVLNLEWNRMDASAVAWLASWLAKQAHPPQKLLLSHNRAIGDMAAQHLFQTLAGISRGTSMPWIEAKYIGIHNLDAFMELLSKKVNFCFALDADACAPDRCASRTAGQTPAEQPQLHLVGILEQRSSETSAQLDSLDSFRSDSQSSFRPFDSQGNDSQETVKSIEAESQGSKDQSQKKVKQDKEERKLKAFPTDLESEDKERRKWAASLGKSGVQEMPDVDTPPPAPSCGMWDLACAEAKKRRRSAGKRSQVTPERKGSRESISHSPVLKDGKDRVSKVTLRTLGTFSENDSDYVALKEVVDARVKRKNELWRALTITESEKWLRQKCLVNELCKQIFEESFRTATASGGSWESFLKTSIGLQHVNQWLDKKLSDATRAANPRKAAR